MIDNDDSMGWAELSAEEKLARDLQRTPYKDRRTTVNTRCRWSLTVAICFSLIAGFLLAASCRGAEPPLYIFFQVGGSSASEPGAVGQGLHTNGWPKTMKDVIEPMLTWGDAAGARVGIVTHHAFGQWTDSMELDSYDYAKGANLDKLTNEFSTAWKPVCEQRVCGAYVGSLMPHARLYDLPAPELAALIRRNLKPYKDAGFKFIIIDNTGDALFHPAVVGNDPNAKGPEWGLRPRNLDAFALMVADDMFGKGTTGIEATPRRFREWGALAGRPTWSVENTWLLRHGRLDLGEQHTLASAMGWGAPNYLRAPAHRIVIHGYPGLETPERMIQECRRIVAEQNIPAISPWAVMNAKIPASEIFKK